MILKSITYGNDQLVKGTILSDSNKEYISSFDGDSGITWCTCPFYLFHKTTCKHILFLLDNINYGDMKPTKRFDNLQCGCLTIDTLMGNGFPLGSVTAIFGESSNGKTLLSAQLALACIKTYKRDVIIFETEGNRVQDYLELLHRFKDRYGLTEEEIDSHIHFFPIIGEFQSQSMIELLKVVGYEAEMEQSTKGDKYSVTFKNTKSSVKDEIFAKSGLLIIDSLTKPLKSSIGHKSQNLPTRAELTARFFDRIFQLAVNYNLGVIILHHASVNKMTPFGRDFGNPYGGDEVLYNSKYILEIVDSDMAARAKYGQTSRRIMLVKHPYQKVDKTLYPVNLKENYGFCDET